MDVKKNTPHINVDYFEDLTGDISKASEEGMHAIGERIRVLREEKGLSIQDLAAKTGFDPDLLKKIETRDVYPQLGTVIKLSKSLDAAFGQLLAGAGDKPYAVTRMKDQKVILRSTSHQGQRQLYTYKGLATEVRGRNMEPLIVQLQEEADKEISRHDGEEFVYVLKGTVLLVVGDEQYELSPGDSAYYLSSIPHWITAKSGQATILAVIYEG